MLQQVGTPSEVYLRPANLFVAQFVGSPVMNVLPAEIATDGERTTVGLGGGQRFELPRDFAARLDAALPAGHELVLGVRPEGVRLAREAGSRHAPRSRRTWSSRSGPTTSSICRIGERYLKARTASGFVRAPGDTVWARLDAPQVHFFDAATGEALDLGLAHG